MKLLDEEWCLLADILEELEKKSDDYSCSNYKFKNIVKLLDAI